MMGWLVFSLLANIAFVTASAIPEGVIAADINHQLSPGRFGKRDLNTVYGSYTIITGVGTPPQSQVSILDTGSSDLWINGPWSGETPFYNPAKSPTYEYHSSGFFLKYGSATAVGYWITETMSIAGSTLDNQLMGLVSNPGSGNSVFGLGMVGGESGKKNYPNVPMQLYKSGLTKSNAYSIYLDNLSEATGRILFGGMDAKKYNGTLYKIPLTDPNGFYIDVDSIKVGPEVVADTKFDGLLDIGTTFSYLPHDIVDNIAKMFNGKYQNSSRLYFVDSNDYKDMDFEFNLSGAKFKVPLSEMLVESDKIIKENSLGRYVLGVIGSESPPFILGDTFMRSVYAVFDLVNKNVGLGQASYESSGNITLLTPYGIPGAVSPPGYQGDNQGGLRTILTIATAPPGTIGL
jgi:hypothetical protein